MGNDSKEKNSDDQAVNIADMVDSQVETYGDAQQIGFWEGLDGFKKAFLILLALLILGLLIFVGYQAFAHKNEDHVDAKRRSLLIKKDNAIKGKSRQLQLDNGKEKKHKRKKRKKGVKALRLHQNVLDRKLIL